MTFEKLKEPYIVVIDDLEGEFEIISWNQSEDEANDEYDSWDEEYPDRQGRNKHIFKMIRTTGRDLEETAEES